MPLLFFARAAGCRDESVALSFPRLRTDELPPPHPYTESLWRTTPSARGFAKKTTRHVRERLIEVLLFLGASVSVVVTLGIVLSCCPSPSSSSSTSRCVDFLTDTQWTPLFDDAHYGIMVLLSGTMVSSRSRWPWRFRSARSSRSTCRSSRHSRCVRSPSRSWNCWAACRPSSTAISRCCSSPRCCRFSFPVCPASTCSPPGWSWAS